MTPARINFIYDELFINMCHPNTAKRYIVELQTLEADAICDTKIMINTWVKMAQDQLNNLLELYQ